MWHRRGSEALVVVEVLATFLVVAMVATFALRFALLARQPLGFDGDNLLRIEATGVGDADAERFIARRETILSSLATVAGVEAVAGLEIAPWESSDMVRESNGLRTNVNIATPEAAAVLRLEVVAGRFFEAADASLPYPPVVIDQLLATQAFGEEDPIGKVVPFGEDYDGRVVGVISTFREDGEFAAAVPYMFENADHPATRRQTGFLVRLSPNADAGTERAIAEQLQVVGPEWTFDLTPLGEIRDRAARNTFGPMIVASLAAMFLLATIGLGLTGVVWQNVARRTRELGLRRAIGASSRSVLGQIILEVVVLCAVGVTGGLVVLVQLPLFGFDAIVPTPILAGGAALGATVVLGLGALCALHPGRLAMRVDPAVALRQG
jgi:putative ABC transport system permease protein